MNISHRTLLLLLPIVFALPSSLFAQSPYWLDVSPDTVVQSPGSPNCSTITVGGGEYMTIDVLYSYEGNSPQEILGWLSLDENGQVQVCADGMTEGHYVFVGVRNTQEWWNAYTGVWAPLNVLPPPQSSPLIYALGPGCDNWDCIWITGAHFQPDSRVFVYRTDWTAVQLFYGPAWAQYPGMNVTSDGAFISFQITDPAVRTAFGNEGVYLYVLNSDGTTSNWGYTQSPPPVVTVGGPGCEDATCIWLMGSFPLNATVDLRVAGQPDVIPDAYTDLTVTPTWLAFRVKPDARHSWDVSGLNAWVVNAPLQNWSGAYYVPPVDRSITGYFESVTQSGLQYYVNGWACARTYAGSIDVHVYVGGPYGTGTFAFAGTANISSEPNLKGDCNTMVSQFRFSIPIPDSIIQTHGGQPIYIHGISPFGLVNSLIANSGALNVPTVDRSVTGWISGIVVESQQYMLKGWACAKTDAGSIDVHLYAGGPYGTFVGAFTANQDSSDDPSIAAACNTSGTHHRFSIPLTMAMRQLFGGQPLYIYGISPFAGLAHLLIGNSGNFNMPVPVSTSSKEYIYLGDRILAVDTTNLP